MLLCLCTVSLHSGLMHRPAFVYTSACGVCVPLRFSVYVYMHFIQDWIQMKAPRQSFGSECRVCNSGWQSLRVSLGLCKQLRAAALPLQFAEDAHSLIKGNWGTCGLKGQRQIMWMCTYVNKQTHCKKRHQIRCFSYFTNELEQCFF